MVYRNSSGFRVSVAALAIAVIGVAAAHAGGKAEKIQISEPSTSGTSSNLTRISPNAKDVDEDLLKPFRSFNTDNSLDAIFNLPQNMPLPQPNQSRPLSKRAQDQIERRKNWAFTDLNDLNPQPSMDEMMGVRKVGPDGKDDSSQSLIEKYYQNRGVNPADGKKPGRNPYETTGDKKTGANADFDPLTSALKHTDPFFKKMMTGESGDVEKSAADAGVFTAASFSSGPDAAAREQQKRVAMFRHEIDPSYPLPKPENTLGLADLTSQVRMPGAVTNAPLFGHTDINPATGFLDSTAKAFRSHVYDDPNATALGLPQKSMFPVIAPTPPPPTAQSIQALIDPFNANAPRRKF